MGESDRSRYELLALRREMAEIAKLEADREKVIADVRRLRSSRFHDIIRTTLLVVGAACAVASTVAGWLQM